MPNLSQLGQLKGLDHFGCRKKADSRRAASVWENKQMSVQVQMLLYSTAK